MVEGANLGGGGGGVFSGAEVVVEGGADGGEDEFTDARHVDEVGSHEPGAEVDEGLDGGGVEDGGGAEERGGADVGKELLDVAQVKVSGGGGAEDGGGLGRREGGRRRESGGERSVRGFEWFCGCIVSEVP